MLAQYNVLKFYDSLAARQWNSLESDAAKESHRVFFENGHLPAIQVITDVSVSAYMYLLDSDGNTVGTPLTMVVEDATTYKRLIYLGTTLIAGQPDGDYSLMLVNGHDSEFVTSDIYYSDVFGWTSDTTKLAELLKISAVSSDITLGRAYSMNLTDFTFECYVNALYLGIVPDFEDTVAERDGVGLPIHGNLVPTREWEIDAVEYIYRFLLGLRILEVNGTVTVTWKGVSYTANDIMAEKSEDAHEVMQVKLSFVDISEVISVDNDV